MLEENLSLSLFLIFVFEINLRFKRNISREDWWLKEMDNVEAFW